MTELLTAAQMRALEQAAMAVGAVTGRDLMERAGRGAVDAIFAEWPDLAAAPHRAVVLCGPGNNGGDGFVVARLLHDWGWQVALYLYGDAEKLPPDARANHDRWRALGPVLPFASAPTAADAADLYVDALFGTGLKASCWTGCPPAPLIRRPRPAPWRSTCRRACAATAGAHWARRPRPCGPR